MTTVLDLAASSGGDPKSPKRGTLEVELKSNEMVPSDPIPYMITLGEARD